MTKLKMFEIRTDSVKRIAWTILLVAGLAAPAAAQNEFVKVRVTSTAADALCVGGTGPSPASTACTGGIAGGALTLNSSGATATIGAGGTGSQSRVVLNGSSGNSAGFYVEYDANGIVKAYHGLANGIVTGTSNDLALYSVSDGMRFYTNSTLRWGINSAGDRTFGTSSNISDSNGTPSVSSGGGTGAAVQAGPDFSFRGTTGSTASTTLSIAFGHTFANAPSCTANLSSTNAVGITTSTSLVTLTYPSVTSNNFFVQCRGF